MSDVPIPQHLIDQHAASIRDSGLSDAELQACIVALTSGFDAMADALEQFVSADFTFPAAAVVDMLRTSGHAWAKVGEQL